LEDDLLVALLNDERDEIRRPAIDIVGMRRVQNLRSFLVDAIGSEEMWTAFHAVEALGRFRDDDAKTRLLSILERGPDFLRISAAKALGEWEDEALAAELEVYLDDENIDVARAAAEAIDSLHGGTF
ncbi:MAG TPA: HEAT repeat domain-containing protein, partial [Deltaproteobacteria bacterium]|nr:HEAT repeat domain-containing protein [Deltaproteobacteria bacterium]